jgi:hypothetical protein
MLRGFDAIHQRHGNIYDRYSGVVGTRFLNSLYAVGGGRYEFYILCRFQQITQTSSYRTIIVDNQN